MLLAIESSCDDSALALWEGGIRAEWVHTQLEEHARYGGVVPDLASRGHLTHLQKLLEHVRPQLGAVKAIAVTRGPGLAPCLAMGISLARSLGIFKNIPVFGVNHLHGHAFSVFLPLFEAQGPQVALDTLAKDVFPHLGLLVSGGNTLAFCIDSPYRFQVLAQTQDDAAGEALDKGARLLGFPYPGGARIEQAAQGGDPSRYRFPQAFPSAQERKFSFSGLKTSLRYRLQGLSPEAIEAEKPHLCASYQEAVIGALLRKLEQLAHSRPFKSLGLSGGVSQNTLLRSGFQALGASLGLPVHLPHPRHTADNASMIAIAHALAPHLSTPAPFSFNPSLGME